MARVQSCPGELAERPARRRVGVKFTVVAAFS
ncbi:Uncharacterised protein [Mycobacteroides abscessus]|nr:Uncharacterised protein [Mycobacteroides abscessus]